MPPCLDTHPDLMLVVMGTTRTAEERKEILMPIF
jgi:hypothetical protein